LPLKAARRDFIAKLKSFWGFTSELQTNPMPSVDRWLELRGRPWFRGVYSVTAMGRCVCGQWITTATWHPLSLCRHRQLYSAATPITQS